MAQKRETQDPDDKNVWSVLADLIGKNRETQVIPFVVHARHGGKLLRYALDIYKEEIDNNELDNFSREHLRDLFQRGSDSKTFWTEEIRSQAALTKRYPLPNWG